MILHGDFQTIGLRQSGRFLAALAALALASCGPSDATTSGDQSTQATPAALSGSKPAPAVEDRGPDAGPGEQAPRLPSRMVGRVTVADSGESVAGATLHVVVGRMEFFKYSTLPGRSNQNGEYIVGIPVGHARSVAPELPPGYWGEPAFETFVTGAGQPEFRKDYVVHRGPVWQVRVAPSDKKRPLDSIAVNASCRRKGRSLWTKTGTDDRGVAQMTLPEAGGDFQIDIYDKRRPFDAMKPANLIVDEGFSPDDVAEIKSGPKPETFQMIDGQGRGATLAGARATLSGSVPTIEFDIPPPAPGTSGRVSGVIVDDHDAPIAGAAVALAMESETGGGITSLHVSNDDSGRFVLHNLPTQAGQSDAMKLILVVTKEGYAGLDSEASDLPLNDNTPLDVGRLRLDRAQSVRLRVVGADNRPLAGAWVEPNSGYSSWSAVTVTDVDGRCVVRKVRRGTHHFRAEYGNLYATFAGEAGNDKAETVVQLKPLPRTQAIPAITGTVRDPDGNPVPKAVVRRCLRQLVYEEPVIADEDGRFELSESSLEDQEGLTFPLSTIPVVGFDPYGPLSLRTGVPIDNSQDVVLTLEPHEPDWPLQELTRELGAWSPRSTSPDELRQLEKLTLRGKPAPELDGILWLNAEKPSMRLADYRGKYVLLDFWDIGCAPCHGDFPSIRQLYELYKEKGLVVISVHDSTDELELVREDVARWKLPFPIVVDGMEGRLMKPYAEHGITNWPSYILVGPDGTVLEDEITAQPMLQFARIEIVRKYLAEPR